MRVVFGLPPSSHTIILGKIDFIPSRISPALEEKNANASVELFEFFGAEEVTSWKEPAC